MYDSIVKVTFKDKRKIDGVETEKRYSAKKPCKFYESTAEAVKDLGERNALDFINEQVRTNFATALRDRLKAKVLGEADAGDIEELELD